MGSLAEAALIMADLVLVTFAIGMAVDAGVTLFVIILTPFEQIVHHLIVASDGMALLHPDIGAHRGLQVFMAEKLLNN